MKLSLAGLLIAAAAFAAGDLAPAAAAPAGGVTSADTVELSAQTTRRPRITIYPRRTSPGPNAKRYCRSWLVKEYRVSGTVIVPRTRCWWQ